MTSHEAVVERVLRAGVAAGRDGLAQLAYQMARTCLRCAESKQPGLLFRWYEEPRDVTELRSDMLRLEARTGLALEKQQLPLANPSSHSAVEAGQACLDVAQTIEGSSTRSLYVRALLHRSDGSIEEAADRMRHLLRGPLTGAWYGIVQEGLQTSLLKLEKYRQVVSIGEQLLARAMEQPTAAYNLATALAWMDRTAEFQQAAGRFKASLVGVTDRPFWNRLIDEDAGWFAKRLARDPVEVRASLGAVDRAPPSGERSQS